MSEDDRRQRNGRDAVVVPMPVLHEQRPPVRPMATTWRTEQEWQRSLTNKVVEMVPAVNGISEQLGENTAQTIVLTRAVNKLAEIVQEQPRDPEKSYHEFDPAVAELRREMKRRIKDGDDPLTDDSAVEFMQRVLVQLRERREEQSDARKWRTVKKGFGAVTWETFKYFWPSAVVAFAMYLWHWLSLHH